MAAKNILDDLNEAQKEAVQHINGPVLVVAGAGSGKTRVLTYRIAYLIQQWGVNPSNILAVTFTNKASNEMKDRIAALVGDEAKHIWAGTFHSICSRILRMHGEAIGIKKDFTIFDAGDQASLISECVEQMGVSDKKFQPRPVLALISKAKEQLVGPEDFGKKFVGEFENVVGRIYKLYQQKLKENSALDFDDLIFWAVRLLQERPEVRSYYHERFHYIMVDEYQDINYVQYMLIKLLAGERRNVCCVGDDDQSIYRWRGADVGLILQFEHDYPDAVIYKLEQNYRSTKTILEAAHEIVSRNVARRDKELWTENSAGRPLDLYEAANEQDEAIHIANVILNKVTADNRRFSDFVILYRMNAQSRVFEDVFLSYRIPQEELVVRRELLDLGDRPRPDSPRRCVDNPPQADAFVRV